MASWRWPLRSLGLWRAVIRRILTDRAVVAAAWLLLLCATTLLSSGTLYGETVALGGLRAAMADVPAADRSLVAQVSDRPGAAAELDADVRPELDRVLAWTGGETDRIIRTGSFADASVDPTRVTEVATFAAYEGIDRHATLTRGRWASPGATPREATLSVGAAAALGLDVGDTITLASRAEVAPSVQVVVTGIWSGDPSDPYWLAPDLEIDGRLVRGGFTSVGPFIVPAADLLDRPIASRVDFEWRAIPDADGYRVEDLGAIRVAVDQVDERLRLAVQATSVRLSTKLGALLATADRAALVSRTGVLLLVVQFAILAAYAIVLVAGMLADRRRTETALLRSRGASTAHLFAMSLLEAILLAGSAAILAPFAAVPIVRWVAAGGPAVSAVSAASLGIGRDVVLVDGITAAVCVVALTLPVLGGGPNLAGIRAAIARQTGRTLAQRLGLDLALVALAAIGLWQLRLYGAPLTQNARGVLGIDPLLVAAPGIGLLAGAVIATRLIPRVAEIGQGVLERGRGLVAAMGGRGMARRPLRYTRSALLLMLAAALGTFASAHVATWTRSQADQAAYQAGADVRVELSQQAAPSLTIAAALGAVPNVTALMPVDRMLVDSGRGVRGGSLLAVDAATAAGIVRPTPDDDGTALPGLFRLLADARPATTGATIPDGSRRLGIVVDTAFENTYIDESQVPPDLSQFDGLRVTVVVEDGLGRLHQLASSDTATLLGAGQRLTIELAGPRSGKTDAPAGLTGPVRVRALDIGLTAPLFVGVTGTVDLSAVEASASDAATAANDWLPIPLAAGDPGWSWRIPTASSASIPYRPPEETPWRLEVGSGEGSLEPVFGGILNPWTARLASAPSTVDALGAIASRGYLVATGAKIGDTVVATLGGLRQPITVLGALDTFPTLDPERPFLVVDGRSLAAARFAANGAIEDPPSWWLSSTHQEATAKGVLDGPDPAADVVTVERLTTRLSTDPVPLGVIGVLGLGSVAALIFAAIGFVVSATVSTRERLGEFALLRALGLSGWQLSLWLSLENAFLLTIGVAIGIGLGLLLAWLVLPFATVTSSGTIAVPAPIVVIPWITLVPIVAVAGAVFVATLIVLRGQLLGIRIGDVLRGRDE